MGKAASGCRIGDLFRLLGEPHMLDILHLFLRDERPRRFTEVQNELRMSPNTLTNRLKALVESGLLSRQAFNEIPPRVEYQATAKARELATVFDALEGWARTNSLEAVAA